MVNIILDKESQKNLLLFLERVNIKGSTEAIAYLSIVQTIQKAKPVEEGE